MSPRRMFYSLLSLVGCFAGLAGSQVARAEDAPAPIKVGVLGVDNYQSVAFTQLFNSPKAEGDLAGLKVVAAWPGGSPDLPDSVDNLPKWDAALRKYGVEIVDSIDELLKRTDVIMVTSVDGRAHLAQLKPVLKAGKPVYIARPLASTLADALAIFRLSEQTKTPLFSCSQHRFSPGFIGMRDHAEVGEVLGCDVYGGCETEPHHALDMTWHAIHGVETLYTIMRPGCVSVRRIQTADADFVIGEWKDGRVGTFRGIRQGAKKYSATVFGTKGVSTAGVYGHGIPVKGVVPHNDKYMGYEGVATEMAKFFKTRQPPVSPAETIEMYGFMQAAQDSLKQGGAKVEIQQVLSAANATAAK